MSRIEKIARLSHDIREQLNRRLRDGQSSAEIPPGSTSCLKWTLDQLD